MVLLLCPMGAETALISLSTTAWKAFREHGESGRWLVLVPIEVAVHLCKNGGFLRLDEAAS
jgi:hypothetical protein